MATSRIPVGVAVAASIAAVCVGIRGVAGMDDMGNFEATAIDALGFEGLLALAAFAGAAFAPAGTATRLALRPGRLGSGPLLLLVVGTLGASLALDGLLDWTGLKRESALAGFEQLIAGVRGPSLLLALVAFAVAPGVSEELLCRGLIQQGLVRRLGAVPGILLASAAFGALHKDPIHAVFAAALGLYLGLVCHLAGSVRASIVCHTANNVLAVLSGALVPDFDAGGVLAVAGGAVVAIGAAWAVWRRCGGPEVVPGGPGGNPAGDGLRGALAPPP
ncbi:MAG: lysostaphin resistance A-like protein [Myxococcota bacterium]